MASLVDICNLALSRLGDEAGVNSIDPPDGSVQAAHCSRFLPMVRDSLLQAHAWSFALRREPLTAVAMPTGVNGWQYAYAVPNQCLHLLAVQLPDAEDDFIAALGTDDPLRSGPGSPPFLLETADDGSPVIFSDVQGAVARFLRRVEDPSRWPPLFVEALTWRLAATVAGPLLKGETGMQQAIRCEQMALTVLTAAQAKDANQGRPRLHGAALATSWLAARR